MKKLIMTLCVALLLVASMAFATDIPVSAEVKRAVSVGPRPGYTVGEITWFDSDGDGMIGDNPLLEPGASDTWAMLLVHSNSADPYTLTITGLFKSTSPGGGEIPYKIRIDGRPIGEHSMTFSAVGDTVFPIHGFIVPEMTTPAPSGDYTDTLTYTVAF